MSVAFDAASTVATGTGNLSWTHTPVGTPRGVKIYVLQDLNLSPQVTAVAYGGVACTFVKSETWNGTFKGRVDSYYLGTGIPTGAQTVDVTVDGTGSNKTARALTVTAGGDTEVVDFDSISGTFTDPTGTLNLLGRTCFCSLGFWADSGNVATNAPLASWTVRTETDFGSEMAGCYSYDTVAAVDVTYGVDSTAGDNFAIVALAVAEVVTPLSPPPQKLFGSPLHFRPKRRFV